MRTGIVSVGLFAALAIAALGQGDVSKTRDELTSFIKSVQLKNVKKSTAPDVSHCFTEVDLDKFKQDGRAEAAAKAALTTPEGRHALASVRALPIRDRASVLADGRKVCRPTWADLGGITPDGSGQTDAGQQADLLVAEQIVSLISAQLKK